MNEEHLQILLEEARNSYRYHRDVVIKYYNDDDIALMYCDYIVNHLRSMQYFKGKVDVLEGLLCLN